MSQLNIHVTPQFERALKRLMKLRGISTKSEAVRVAVLEAADRTRLARKGFDFALLRGAGRKAPLNPAPRFGSHDELWG